MSGITAADRIRTRYDHCFACGRSNPIGLGVDGFAVQNGEVHARFTPRLEYAGFHDLLHGGVIATALDEVMAWAGILLEEVLSLTASLEIKFRLPAPPDVAYRLVGRVENRSGSRLRLSGELLNGASVVAEGRGLYLAHADLEDA